MNFCWTTEIAMSGKPIGNCSRNARCCPWQIDGRLDYQKKKRIYWMGSEHSTLDGPRTAIPNKFCQLRSASFCTLRAKRISFLIHDASISIQLAGVFLRRDYIPQLRNYVNSLPRGSIWKMTGFLVSGNFTESVRIMNFCIGKFIKNTEPNNPVIIFCLPPSDAFPILRGHWPINEFEIKIN